MEDESKPHEQHKTELDTLRRRVAELERLETERQRAEEMLWKTSRRFRSLIENTSNVIAILDIDRIFRYLSSSTANILGYGSEDLVGKHIFEFIYLDDVKTLTDMLEEAMRNPGVSVSAFECCIQHNDNSWHTFAVTITNLFNDPTINGFLINCHDITERKKVEASLQQSEERYRTLVEQLLAITYTVEFDDSGSKTTYISPQVETLLGFTPAEWMADRQLWVKQLHPEDYDNVMSAIERSNNTSEALNIEYRILARNGRVLWFRNQQTTKATWSKNNQTNYIHGVMFDITEQKQLENQLQQAQKMEAVGQMAGGIAHNFNNVLTALIGHAELAMNQVSSDDPIYLDLEGVRKSAQRAARLIQQLLAFTRHQTIHPQVINLNELVFNMTIMLRQLISEAIELKMLAAPDLGQVKMDPNQVEQVLINLVVNARDAMLQGGRLTIETANTTVHIGDTEQRAGVNPGDYVMLTVSDTGAGMTKEVISHIFEPFFSTKGVGKGTGLGLSSCIGIVRQNDGYILVDSEPGHGTTFKIYLPRFYSETPQSTLVMPAVQNMPQGNETILVVEDAIMVREMTVRVLRQQGYTVLEAGNGEDALLLVEEQHGLQLQLLIADVVMPQMGGDVLAKRLLAAYPDVKILLISGYSDKAIARRGVLEQEVAVLSKPFTPNTLTRKVRRVLDGTDEK